MTFIPLSQKNFKNNKVESLLKVEYIDSDPTTFIYDQSIDSKSLININNYKVNRYWCNKCGFKIQSCGKGCFKCVSSN